MDRQVQCQSFVKALSGYRRNKVRIVDLKCENCGGKLRKEGDYLVCDSCGASFAVDYDESDVEYERLQGEAARMERQYDRDKEIQQMVRNAKKQQAARSGMAILLILFIMFGVITFGIYMFIKTQVSHMAASENAITATPTPAPDYHITPEDVAGSMSEFIEAGRIAQMYIDECAYWDGVSSVKYFHKTDAVFIGAYIVTDIPNVRENKSNRLVLIYEVTWHNDNMGDQICYDAVYFEGLSINPNGGIISDFSPKTIMRSDAAWGWSMAYSFEDQDQCYRENVTALGGVVTEVPAE